MKNFNLPFLALILLILYSCGTENRKIEKFSDTNPYAIEIAQERSYYQAEKLTQRLLDMGIDAYMVENRDTTEEKNVGVWYSILTGSIVNLDSAKSIRKRIEQEYKLEDNELKIATYTNYSKTSINLDSLKSLETKRVYSKKPDVKEDVFSVIKKFPESNALYVQNATIFSAPDSVGQKKGYNHIYSLKMDLPRGVKKKLLLERTTAFSEVVYKDNLYGDRVTIEIGKLRNVKKNISASIINTKNRSSFDIAKEYADLILETGDYLFEEKKELEINSYTKLYGYKVTIEPKRDYFRTYLILVDESNQYIIFSQSTDKSEEELISILSDIGKGEGLLNYDEFYNVFYTIPERLVDNDIFIGFTISKLGWSYARNKNYTKWSKAYVGYWSANGYFYNSKKGFWSYGIFDILTESEQVFINELYDKESRAKKIDVYGVEGYVIKEKKFNPRTWKSYYKITEINFGIGRYTCMVDNTENSWLSKSELIERAEALQFLNKSNVEDPQLAEK